MERSLEGQLEEVLFCGGGSGGLPPEGDVCTTFSVHRH